MNFLKLLMQRPSDKTIKIIRTIFGLLLMLTAYYNLVYQGDALETNFFGQETTQAIRNYIKYAIVALGAVLLIFGITDFKVVKSKYVRYTQLFLAVLLFYISSKIAETPTLDFDVLVFLMAFLPIFAGATGKLITKTGLKHGQKITKVRI